MVTQGKAQRWQRRASLKRAPEQRSGVMTRARAAAVRNIKSAAARKAF